MTLDSLVLGQAGPIVWRARYERALPDGTVLEDVTPAVVACDVTADEDRAIYRTARFAIDPRRPEAAAIDPLRDCLRATVDVLVDGEWQPEPVGLFVLTMPRHTVSERGVETWEIEAADVLSLLAAETTTSTFAVPAGAPIAETIQTIITERGLRAALAPSSAALPVARQWTAGTPWLQVCNELAAAAGFYALWADRFGIVRSMPQRDLASVAPAMRYGPGAGLVGEIRVESELTRLANRVVVVNASPEEPPVAAVAENRDPRSPLSIPRLGRVYTKVLEGEGDEEALHAIAERYLEREAGLYRRVVFSVLLDPRRDAHEVYELEAPAPAGGRWWSRGHRFALEPGALMEIQAARVILGGLE